MLIAFATNWVVATCVLLTPFAAVTALIYPRVSMLPPTLRLPDVFMLPVTLNMVNIPKLVILPCAELTTLPAKFAKFDVSALDAVGNVPIILAAGILVKFAPLPTNKVADNAPVVLLKVKPLFAPNTPLLLN